MKTWKQVRHTLALAQLFLLLAALIALSCGCGGDTRVQTWIHDEPFKLSDKTVEHLYITVEEIAIKPTDGEWITLRDDAVTMDILAITANDPVLLSDTRVDPGTYEQLRLILAQTGNRIVVDGETFDIDIPSSEHTGVKFPGPFTIPEGRIFKFVMDFDAKKSVLYTKGEGYKMKPVIHLDANQPTDLIVGCFNGFLPLEDVCSTDPGTFDGIQLNLTEEGLFTARATIDRDASLRGGYVYDSTTGILTLDDIKVSHASVGNCSWWDIVCKKKRKKLKNLKVKPIRLRLESWSHDQLNTNICGNIHVLSLQGSPGSCDLPIIPEPTRLAVTVDNLSPNWGSDHVLAVEVWRADQSVSADVATMGLSGRSSQRIDMAISHTRFAGETEEFTIRAFIGKRAGDDNTVLISNVTGTVTGAFLDRTDTPGKPLPRITLNRSGAHAASIRFPERMDITVTPPDFSSNPTFSWTPLPGISKYLVTISVQDRNPNDGEGGGMTVAPVRAQGDGNAQWDLLNAEVVEGTSLRYVPAGLLLHTGPFEGPTEGGPPQHVLPPGALIRVEVVAIDPGATSLNRRTKAGVHSVHVQHFAFGGV